MGHQEPLSLRRKESPRGRIRALAESLILSEEDNQIPTISPEEGCF